MSDYSFLQSVYRVAEKAKRAPLTQIEKDLIEKDLKTSTGSAYSRAIQAIKKVIGIDPQLIMEKAAALDDINRLLADLKMEAQKLSQ